MLYPEDNDVADSFTGNNVVVATATLTDNEDDLPEIEARATNTNEVVGAPGPGSSNQLHHSEDPGLVGEGAPVRPMVVGGGGEREGLVPHHSEELGLLGEGAPVRPRVAGGGVVTRGRDRNFQGIMKIVSWRSPLMTIWTLLMRGVRSLIMRKQIVMILRTSLKIWMMLEVQLKEC